MNKILLTLIGIALISSFATAQTELNDVDYTVLPYLGNVAVDPFDDEDQWNMAETVLKGDIEVVGYTDTTDAVAVGDVLNQWYYGKVWSLEKVDSVKALHYGGRDSAAITSQYRKLMVTGDKFAAGPWTAWGTATFTNPRMAVTGAGGGTDSLIRVTPALTVSTSGNFIQLRHSINNNKAMKLSGGRLLIDSNTAGRNRTWQGAVAVEFIKGGK